MFLYILELRVEDKEIKLKKNSFDIRSQIRGKWPNLSVKLLRKKLFGKF